MGKEIKRCALPRNIGIQKIFTSKNNLHGVGLTVEALKDIDVCIDFSTSNSVLSHIEAVAACGKNIVVGTTGWYNALDEVKSIVEKNNIGLLYSPNFSIGMNIFAQTIASAARCADTFGLYDAAIHEIHHRGKADSPSGTALMLGEIILRHLRPKKEIFHETAHQKIQLDQLHIASSRIGETIGTHRVIFDSDADSIELVHTAKNRSGFALGALIAAEWLKGKKGFFTMNDVLPSL